MTLEQVRIKIAEACGWTIWRAGIEPCKAKPDGSTSIWRLGADVACEENLPDPYDLNACHEMEKVLRKRPLLWQKYVDTLNETLSMDDAIHATAAQRCEAFLKTLELLKS